MNLNMVQSDLLKWTGKNLKSSESLLVLFLEYDRKILEEEQHFQKYYRLQ